MTTVRYPAKAARALGFLKSHSNDVDIFVEDKGNRNIWLKFLRKFLPAGVRLQSVTPLGGRAEVLRACRADQGVGGRKRLYIIDADMDLLTGAKKPKLKRLYRLRRYCLENYLIDQRAFIEVITSLNPRISEDPVNDICGIQGWTAKNEEPLRALFTVYAIAQHLTSGAQYLGSGIVTVAYSCHKLFADTVDFCFCPHKVRIRALSIYRHMIKNFGKDAVKSAMSIVSQRARGARIEVFCSGKNYILPALYERSKRGASFSVSIEVFKTLLCDHLDASVDPYLTRRLASL